MTSKTKSGRKGYELEEVLRAYFLRAGFFVLRGIPYSIDDESVTDIDLWLYERSSSTARRCQMVDIKNKSRPKAFERIIWTKGLLETLDLDGAYVATTDNRKAARKIANKLGIKLLDGNDVQRIQLSGKVLFEERVTDEHIAKDIKELDNQRRNKDTYLWLNDLKSSVLIGLGANSLVRSLDAFNYFIHKTVEAQPNSDAATLLGRLAYLSASLIALNLDYLGAEASFRTNDERRNIFINAIRYGNKDRQEGLRDARVATELIRQYIDNGSAIAKQIEDEIRAEYNGVPAEIIADQIIKFGRSEELFNCARALEQYAYKSACPNFDALEAHPKSFIATLLDFNAIDRTRFASAWQTSAAHQTQRKLEKNDNEEHVDESAGPLFKKSTDT